jgi:hypothetical protein
MKQNELGLFISFLIYRCDGNLLFKILTSLSVFKDFIYGNLYFTKCMYLILICLGLLLSFSS